VYWKHVGEVGGAEAVWEWCLTSWRDGMILPLAVGLCTVLTETFGPRVSLQTSPLHHLHYCILHDVHGCVRQPGEPIAIRDRSDLHALRVCSHCVRGRRRPVRCQALICWMYDPRS